MNQELAGQVAGIVERLEGIAPHVWEVMLRQQYVVAVGWIGFILVTVVVGIVYYRYAKKLDWAGVSEFKGTASVLACLVVGIMSIISVVALLTEVIPRLINPEYYALVALIPGG